VVDDPEERRYELWVGDARAGIIEYLARGDTIWLLHTEVDRAYEGEGLGRRLVAGALEDIRTRGLRLVPICPFVRAYLTKHREDEDLVAPVGAGGRERLPGEGAGRR
jgi:predicted GNAT family acetyltransferase